MTPADDLVRLMPVEALALVEEQAKDEALWFCARTAPEGYLQAALRKLHAAVERGAQIDIACQHAARIEALQAEVVAVRELMNVYNLGGWTDAIAPMQRAEAAERRAEAAEGEVARLKDRIENSEGIAAHAKMRACCETLLEHLTALVWDMENKVGDPHTLRHAKAAIAAQDAK